VFHKRYAKRRVVHDYRAIAAKVSCVTVLNTAMAQRMHERFGDLFHTVTIPNGIEDDWLAAPGESAKDILLCAGRLSADKCYGLAVAAYAGSASRQYYPLVIIGEGENEQAIIDQAQRHQIDIVKALPSRTRANTLYLAGYRSGEEKRQLFARARLFLHPSRFEAFGIVLLEAMAQGAMPLCAGLATYRSQFPTPPFELCYVDEAQAPAWTSAIDDAIASPQLEQHCNGNRKAVANFAWSRIFERYMDCYQMALAPRKPDALQ
jgi:glycosyltransferase involved in cell wall biosynthesis